MTRGDAKRAADGASPRLDDRDRLALSAGLASFGVAATLVLLKLWALVVTGALSVGASLADSALDLLMSGGAALAILYAARPADEDHAYGHTSVEDLAALAQALLITVSAVIIGWAAIGRLVQASPRELTSEGAGIIVMVASILMTLALVWWQGSVARRTGSRVVAADRLHYLGDLGPSIGAVVALWVSHRFGIGGVDAWVAILAALYMIWGAFHIARDAWDALMDHAADPEQVQRIADLALGWPGVRGFHGLRTRMAGSRIFVRLHVELDGDQTLREAHAISAGLRRAILRAFPRADVIIHKDVFGEGMRDGLRGTADDAPEAGGDDDPRNGDAGG